jgi:hypothetical protein
MVFRGVFHVLATLDRHPPRWRVASASCCALPPGHSIQKRQGTCRASRARRLLGREEATSSRSNGSPTQVPTTLGLRAAILAPSGPDLQFVQRVPHSRVARKARGASLETPAVGASSHLRRRSSGGSVAFSIEAKTSSSESLIGLATHFDFVSRCRSSIPTAVIRICGYRSLSTRSANPLASKGANACSLTQARSPLNRHAPRTE